MSAGVFVLQELPQSENATDEDLSVARFEWTADRVASSSSGGARACPTGAWVMGGQIVRSRTDYPGASAPSEQILTSVHKDHRFEGSWSDKWNFRGYAVAEMTRFEAMAKRGSLVEVSYQAQVFRGVILDWDFSYKGDWEIGYRFSVSVHNRAAQPSAPTGRAETRAAPEPSQEDALDALNASTTAMLAAQTDMPRNIIVGDLAGVADVLLSHVIDARNTVAATMATLPVGGGFTAGGVATFALQGVDQWRRLGTRFRSVEHQAAEFVDALVDVRTDITVGIQNVQSFFSCERWSRASRYYGRVAMGDASGGAAAMDKKAAPPLQRTYQAASGESLYAIASRFFGDPMAWRAIAHQNGLTAPVIRDATLLIIPTRAA